MSNLRLQDFLPYQMSIASNAVSEVIAGEYRNRFGLKIPEWRIMAVLGQGQPMNQRDLVRATHMDKVTVNRAAKSLADRLLVERQARDDDGRSHLLLLSATGRELHDAIVPAALEVETRLFAGLSDAERTQLAALLRRSLEAAIAMQKRA